MFFVLGISITVFLLLLLLGKRNKSRADRILLLWFLVMLANQLLFYFQQNELIYNYPHWLGVVFPIPVLHGVLLFFYSLEITGNRLKKPWYIFLHLLPTLSLVILAIPFYLLSGPEKIEVFRNEGRGYEWYMTYQNILIPLSGLAYSVWSLKLVKEHQRSIRDTLSNTDKKELQWLKYLSVGFAIIWLVSIFFEEKVIFSAVAWLVIFIGFFGINQLSIFTQVHSPADSDSGDQPRAAKPNARRYAKSGLTSNSAQKIHSELVALMDDKKLFKNENLTLKDLAEELNIHPNYISQVINEKEGKNFYHYINSLRVQEFIKLASNEENKKYTFLSLAYDCGFNAKSTFNKHFKHHTGKTPSEYVEALNKEPLP